LIKIKLKNLSVDIHLEKVLMYLNPFEYHLDNNQLLDNYHFHPINKLLI
jgi:hypothetical protein